MKKPNHNPSIHQEPHLSGAFEIDPREEKAAKKVARATARAGLDQQVEHSVWDEPGLSPGLSGAAPKDALTYAAWLDYRVGQMGHAKSWFLASLIALSAGPWSLYGTFAAMLFGGGGAGLQGGVFAITIFGPLVEEVMKVAAILWVVEKRPYIFKSRMQIAFCALFSAWVFATLENLLYLNVYIKNPTMGIIYWRWIVCTALHMSCTFVTAVGLMRMWKEIHLSKSLPQLGLCAPFLVAAIILHGSYNTAAIIFHLVGFTF